jgi:hypothetical protein
MNTGLEIDAAGWVTSTAGTSTGSADAVSPNGLARAILRSPNFDARPTGVAPDLIVIHNISLPPGQFGGGESSRLGRAPLLQ